MDYRDRCGQIFNSGFIQLEPILNVIILILQQPSKKRISYFISLKQKPRNFTEAFIFLFFCILLLFTFYFQDFPASSPSQTPILSGFPGQQPSLLSRLLCILWHPESLSQWRVKLFSSHLLFFGYEERSYLRLYANSLLFTYAIREAHFHSLAFIFMPAESICLLEK